MEYVFAMFAATAEAASKPANNHLTEAILPAMATVNVALAGVVQRRVVEEEDSMRLPAKLG